MRHPRDLCVRRAPSGTTGPSFRLQPPTPHSDYLAILVGVDPGSTWGPCLGRPGGASPRLGDSTRSRLRYGSTPVGTSKSLLRRRDLEGASTPVWYHLRVHRRRFHETTQESTFGRPRQCLFSFPVPPRGPLDRHPGSGVPTTPGFVRF